eukprot:gnl/MRDRNA2_/MRDRNA2_50593_c0_seq2.p1 gnl/MRDRNA2_/MRDRNA2_50593_c0~~gnl/MRDRNA2_/MRDRNA2_50593_c0_seq2.p1  ORF type:complete len:276 (-),score=38.69 gnl/MRDRNA2_/MRDRNA2_50593_c0_seq2:47-874(-)
MMSSVILVLLTLCGRVHVSSAKELQLDSKVQDSMDENTKLVLCPQCGFSAVRASEWAVIKAPWEKSSTYPGAIGAPAGVGTCISNCPLSDASQGKADFKISCAKDIDVTLKALVYTSDSVSNSFWVGIDTNGVYSTTTLSAWHTDQNAGFEVQDVCSGSANDKSPRVFTLSAGLHTLTFLNREDNAWLKALYLSPDAVSTCSFEYPFTTTTATSSAVSFSMLNTVSQKAQRIKAITSAIKEKKELGMRREASKSSQTSVQVTQRGSFHTRNSTSI